MTLEAPDASGEIGLLDYLAIVRRRWIWVCAGLTMCIGATSFWYASRPALYEASSRVLLADTAAQRALDPGSGGMLAGQLPNEIALAQSDVVENLVEQELGVVPQIKMTADTDAAVIVFQASAPSPDEAALFANTWAEQYIAVKRDQAITEINAAAESLRDRLEALRRQRQEVRAPLDELGSEILDTTNEREAAALQREYNLLAGDLSYELDMVTSQAGATTANLSNLELQVELATVGEARIIQVAAPPPAAANSPLSLYLALGSVLGLITGFALAVLAESRDNSVKSVTDIAVATDVPILSSIPRASSRERAQLGVATYHNADGRFAESYHKVRSALEFAFIDREVRTILVTSPNASNGRTTTASNLALAFASVGKRTVLLDADFRRPRQHAIYGVDQAPGFSNVILHGFDLAAVACQLADPGLETLRVIPTGIVPPAPAAFVGTDEFRSTVQWIRDSADIVIIDCPPLLAVSDPQTLARDADGVVLTVRAGSTTKAQLLQAISALKQVGATVLGIVLVGVDSDERHPDYRAAKSGSLRPKVAGRGDRMWREPTGPVIELRDRTVRRQTEADVSSR